LWHYFEIFLKSLKKSTNNFGTVGVPADIPTGFFSNKSQKCYASVNLLGDSSSYEGTVKDKIRRFTGEISPYLLHCFG
jgi:hypothetical protein